MSHVPTGCAVWPAFWTVTADLAHWPIGGEIDILENVNNQFAYNLGSLHVNGQCSVSTQQQSGTTVFPNCNYQQNQQSGCRIGMNGTSTPTWGSQLNSDGGGVVAMQRDFSAGGPGIRMWVWSKKASIPADVTNPGKTVNPDTWGTPNADFGRLSCTGADGSKTDGASQFNDHKIILDITLCGDWAGNAYGETQCPATYQACSNQVGNAGSSFSQAYWKLQNLYVYESKAKSGATGLSPPLALAMSLALAVVVVLSM